MQVGVVSDTHFRSLREGIELFEMLLRGPFSEVEMILHAGDLGMTQILDGFFDLPIVAVRGNTDPEDARLPDQRIMEIHGFRVGLIHGWGPVGGLETRVLKELSDPTLNCLIYGHSHLPVCQWRDGLLWFNPGSPTDRRSAPHHTVGILEFGTRVSGRILCLD